MKKIILFILIGIIFSCTIPDQRLPGIPEFITYEEAENWIFNNIKYKERGSIDYCWDRWQTPDETARKKTGNCVDMCILLSEILWQQFEKDSILCGGQSETSGHTWLEYRNRRFYYKSGFSVYFKFNHEQLQYEIANRQYMY